ncbi:hypothetical protein EDC01DRAFT_103484 [Geopyxis carbonaria]|nr:hypothetical protein EDC01DRAFT_103484 [Geopyxis carbonaria]
MKQRFSSLDLQIISSELRQTVVGHRISNIYDLSARIFLLKFALPDSKHLVVIDSGFRIHLTSFTRETSPTPSVFVTKLRKHLRTRRLTAVKQLGVDRVLDLEFSDGLYHLYLEFFAGGNVILTDRERKMLAVLRVVSGGEDGSGECRVGGTYEATGRELPAGDMRERVMDALTAATTTEEPEATAEDLSKPKRGKFQKKKKKTDEALKKVLGSKMPEFSPVLVEHALLGAGVDPTVVKAAEVLSNEELLGKVVSALDEAGRVLKELTRGEGVNKGYIIAKLPKESVEKSVKLEETTKKKGVSFGSTEAVEREVNEKVQDEGEAKGLVFNDFHPFLPRQFVDVPGIKTLEYEGFNKTVDTFFSSIESQKLESRLKDREDMAAKRLEAAREDHQKRVGALRDVQDLNIRKAQAIEANTYRVEETVAAINGLVQQGMDWVNIARLIEQEQKRKNPVAELIKLPLKLYENTITLNLEEVDWEAIANDEDSDYGESSEEEDSEDEDGNASSKPKKNMLTIDVDLNLSAYANARTYYDQKRSAAEKETKTIKSSTKALKSTERKVAADLKKSLKTEKQIMRPVRKPMWFEKFLFFISSDGYLVLGGRDAQQNEHLYKRHFRRGDIYVHADIHGAATVIVKNNPATPNAPIPPSTLQQAGQLSVCTSQAWDSKAVLSAWWVTYEQVSKTAPTGEFLTTGAFMIRGKKNFLPPGQLILGYGVLWKVDEESKLKHIKHRVEEEKIDEQEKAAEQMFDKGESPPPIEKDAEPQEDEDIEEDGSDDEDFPDARVESADEDEDESDEDQEFPDAKLESDDEVEQVSELKDEDVESETEETRKVEDKYDLSNLSSALSSEPPTPQQPSGDKPRHLSAKQRRDLKKGRSILETTSTVTQTSIETRSDTPASPAPSTPGKPLPRGKRAKAKRAAAKYAMQDEDDRAIALSLLGGTSITTAEDAETVAETETPEARKARLRAQHQRTQATGLAAEAKRHAAASAEEEEEDDEIATTPLDALIPDPTEADTLLDAIPVCAPWGAMGRYKWRVKMQPGAQKKGKAIREVWNGWCSAKGMKGAEKDLVQGWREAEIVNCVGVSKVKVFGAGGSGGVDKGGKGKGGGGAKRGGKGGKRK